MNIFIFLAFFLAFLASLLGGVFSTKKLRQSKKISRPFCYQEKVYFLLYLSIWRKRAPIWFIMPIERRAKIFSHTVTLFCLDLEQKASRKIAEHNVLKEDLLGNVKDFVKRYTDIPDEEFDKLGL